MAKKPNILFFGIDSLRADHMSLYGYKRLTTPHIQQYLSESSLVFDHCFSPHIPTTPGYANMLTGMDCFGTDVVALRHEGPLTDKVKTLAEVLRDEGYNTTCIGFTGNPSSRGFDTYLDYKSSWGSWEEGRSPKAESINEVAIPELERLAAEDKPFMLFLRHMDPHSPYLPPEPFHKLFFQGDEFDPNNKSLEKVYNFKPFCDYFATWFPPHCTSADYIIAQYDAAIAYMDACIANMLQKLADMGLEQDTIVVFTSDHGETLNDHDCYFDHHGLYDCTLTVPFAIRWKGRILGSTRVADFCQLKDVMPTLLDLLEVNTGIDFDGRSLIPAVEGAERLPEPEFYITECTWERKHGWRTPEWKLIVSLEPDFHYREMKELYNLIQDPEENHNVIEENPEIAEALEKRMLNFIAKREAETGRTNPMYTNTNWNGFGRFFTSHDEAYNTMHIGDPGAAQKLQAGNK